jgi:glycosyltransferase involved in cell wall biosynthesis
MAGIRRLRRLVRAARERLRAAALLRATLWATAVPLLRRRARRRLPRLRSGEVTIVTVNWNSSPFLAVLLELVRARSPARTRVIVVDNASSDGTRELLAAHPDVRAVRLPLNVGHELALDIGFLLVESEYAVALDVDAFPLHDRWLDELLAPLAAGNQVAGARLNREYVHPCCLAIRTRRFVERRHSFRSHYRPRTAQRDASGDVGEEISAGEDGQVVFFDATSQRGPGDVGTVFGGFVYHNFYSTRFRATTAAVLDAHVAQTDAATAWDEAVARYGTG